MQRILNDPDHIVDEMLEGFVKAHPDLVKTTAHPRVLAAKEAPIDGKVGVVTLSLIHIWHLSVKPPSR